MCLTVLLSSALAMLPLAGESARGRVLTDDGMPLPESARVELRCEQTVIASTNVNQEGRFEFDGNPRQASCTVSVYATGYRRSMISTEDLPSDPRIAGIVLHRLGKSHGESISVSHLAAPPEAVQRFHAAIREAEGAESTDYEAVLKHLRAAVQLYPDYAQAWFEIGRIGLALGDSASARDALQQAVRADPWFVSPYEPLILLLEAAGQSDQAARTCQRLREINPALSAGCGGL